MRDKTINVVLRIAIVMVKKKDGSNRLCVDFMKLNKITEVDPEPMMTAEDLFRRPSGKKYLSKIDLTKGYCQNLLEFLRMPFGALKKILERLSGADH